MSSDSESGPKSGHFSDLPPGSGQGESPDSWIEVSLLAPDGELAEAVAEVLARYISGGIVIQTDRIEQDPRSEGRPIGPYKVCGYIPNDKNIEKTSQKIREGLWYLSRIQPLPEPEFKPLVETNWVDTWKKHYRPLPVGQSLIVLPAWFDNPDEARIPIVIDPGMAFGTGTHPSTQLALDLLEDAVTAGSPRTVLDIGCGSGILSIAAAKLGATDVLGLDVDADALINARRNLELNPDVGPGPAIHFAAGSVAEILTGKLHLRTAELVIANIIAPILEKLLSAGLAQLVSPGGKLILSGMLEEQVDGVAGLAELNGLALEERRQSGEWVAFSARRAV